MKIDKIDSPVYVGRLDEKGVLSIDFDVSDWLTQFPTGTFTVDFKPDYLSESFSLPPTQYRVADGVLTIDIERNITGKVGRASLGVRLLVGSTVDKRSAIIPVVIAESLPPANGEMPEPIQDWINGATILVAQAAENVIVSAEFVDDDIVFMKANESEVVLPDAKNALKGDQGPQGDVGLTGPKGPKGDQGDGLSILGTKSSIENLPLDGNETGDAWLVDGDLYVWSGAIWKNAGPLQGDKGDKGDQGPQGDKGDKGDNGVYVGSVEPTDPEKNIWIDEDAQQEYSTTYEQAVDNGYTKSKEQFFADLEGLEGAIDGANSAAGLAETAAINANSAATNATSNMLWRRLTTNPASFYPVPQSPLYVRASGEPIQSGIGDPAPDNILPILPWKASGETVKVKRTGKNLLNLERALGYAGAYDSAKVRAWDDNKYYVGLTNTNNYNPPYTTFSRVGSAITVKCVKSGFGVGYPIKCLPNATYLLTKGASEDVRAAFYTLDGVHISTTGDILAAITRPANAYWMVIIFRPSVETTFVNPQLELGSTATPYEPYTEQEITLTAPQDIYGGWMDNEGRGLSIYRKIVFDGSESFDITGGGRLFFYPPYELRTLPSATIICSHYFGSAYAKDKGIIGNSSGAAFTISDTEHTVTTADYKVWLAEQYLAGTPVTITYPLTFPVPLTIPPAPLLALPQADRITPRQNVVATDAQSLQTDYAKSPIQESNEQNAAIVATGV